jgi:hypothetical protein
MQAKRLQRKVASAIAMTIGVVGLTVIAPSQASAATCSGATATFTGSTNSFWDVATNWTGNTLPTGTDQVCIPTTKTVVVRDPSPVASLVAVEGTLHVTTGTLTASNGYQTVTASGSGEIDVDAAGTISAPVVAVQGNGVLLLAGGTLTGDLETDIYTTVTAWGNIGGDLRNGGPMYVGQHLSTTARTLQISGDLTFTPASSFVLDWLDDGGVAGTDYDLVQVVGHLNYYAGKFVVDNPTSVKLGDGKTFTPLTYSNQSCGIPSVQLNGVAGVTLSLDINPTSTDIVSSGTPPAPPVPEPDGYWLATADGKVLTYDSAALGSMSGMALNAPIVGIASTPDHDGYWLVASDGGVFAFGDAAYAGSMAGSKLNAPIIGLSASHDGHGYYLAAADGGVFAYGDAAFVGSAGSLQLSQPVVGIATDADGSGYRLVGADGGVFAYDADFVGSANEIHLSAPVVGLLATDDGSGYRLAGADGGVFAFNAEFRGSTLSPSRVVGIAGFGDGHGATASSSSVRAAC